MNTRLVLLAGSIVLLASPVLHAADTIRLRDGSEIEGKIVDEGPDSVQIEFGGSIKELKTIPRSQILSIDKDTPDELAFEKLKGLFPTPDLLTAEQYDTLIADNFTKFLNRYKESVLIDQVKEMAGRVAEEKARVEAGDIKLNGEWITADEASKNPFDHGARVLVARMQKASASSDYTLALEHFDLLQKDYFYSTRFGPALVEAKAILPKYDAMLARLETDNATLMKEREENLKGMDIGVRQRTERAFNDQIATFEATRQAARDKGKTWLPVSKWHAESITEARETVKQEIRRLNSIRADNQQNASTAYAAATASLAEGKLEEAAKALSTARSNGMKGELYEQLDAQIKTGLKAAADAKREAERAEREAALAEAEAAAQKEKEEKERERERKEKERKASTSTAVADTDTESDDEDDGGGIPFQVLLIGLAVVLGAVTFFAKKFGTKDDGEE